MHVHVHVACATQQSYIISGRTRGGAEGRVGGRLRAGSRPEEPGGFLLATYIFYLYLRSLTSGFNPRGPEGGSASLVAGVSLKARDGVLES